MTTPAPGKPCGICRAANARLYMQGWRCAVHAPPKQPTPDPLLTAVALYERRMRQLRALARSRRRPSGPP